MVSLATETTVFRVPQLVGSRSKTAEGVQMLCGKFSEHSRNSMMANRGFWRKKKQVTSDMYRNTRNKQPIFGLYFCLSLF